MYKYTVINHRNKVIAEDECAFGSLTKVLDHYGEKNFTIVVKKSIDQKELRN